MKALPQLSFTEALKQNYEKLTDIKGRSRRSELWWNFLVYIIVSMSVGLMLSWINIYLLTLLSLVIQLWVVPVTIRRMHDNNHSGVWVVAAVLIGLTSNIYGAATGINSARPEEVMEMISRPAFTGLYLASFIVNIIILVFSLQDSSKETNKYGPSPKYVEEV